MLPPVRDLVWVFDCEWAPDPASGRVLYNLPAEWSDAEVVAEMWKRNGATDDNPFPYLRTILCRVLSIAVVQRRLTERGPEVQLLWLPRHPDDPTESSEKETLKKFLEALGQRRPQLVGYNSQNADLKILIQRAVVYGLSLPKFFHRPSKPWDAEPDYLARGNSNDWNVDLMEIIGPRGAGSTGAVSLHEIATLSGIPGKFQGEGQQVAHLWLAGQWRAIIRYNCCDAITTYLLWLRMAHVAGHFTAEQYEDEQENVRQMLMDLAEQEDGQWAADYLDEWNRLQAATGQI